jgi:uncharacterized damage-inducible protein DinB
MSQALTRLIRYDIWANRETMDAVRQGAAPPPRSLRWMAHIIGAEYLWLARLTGQTSPLPVWPNLSLDGCDRRLDDLSPQLLECLADATPERLSQEVAYTNSKGEAWTNTVEEILTHVTIHSAYHRGQIAADLRAAGQVPPYTDYIHAVRQGLIE